MRRFTLATLLACAGLFVPSVRAQDLPPSLIARNADLSGGEQPERRTTLELAEEALAAGLSSTASMLFTQGLADARLNEADRERAGLGLSAACIERTRTAEAKAALKFLPASSRKALREALVALLDNDLAAAKLRVGEINLTEIPPPELAWVYALKWMLAAAEGDNFGVNVNLEAVGKTAVSEVQRQRIEILGYRASIIAGRVEERTVSALKELAAAAKNTPLAFAYSRNLALALAHLKRPTEAARALAESGPLPANRQAEADLLAGLILGPNTTTGRDRLKDAAKNPANTSVRIAAIHALVFAAEDEQAKNNPIEAKAISNEVYDFLMRHNEGQLAFLCPRDPKILDTIHLARAQLMLVAGNREKARQAAEDLLHDVPASPLAREATRTLALAAWGDGSFRLAANHITTLSEGTIDTRRDKLRTVAADCLFLAKDYVLAEKAYAIVQTETTLPDLAFTAFHQRVQCLLLQGDEPALWNRTAEVIEEASRKNRFIPRERLWMAVWNLIDDARKANQPTEAVRLLARLTPIINDTKIDFTLRFDWLKALIALSNHQPDQAAKMADSIATRLEKLPPEATDELRKAIPELRAHVALLKARSALDTGSIKGMEELISLRKKYGKVAATAASYLVEGRHLAAAGKNAEAQARFEALAKEFQGDAALSEFAQLGLYEAAEQAALQAPTEGEAKLKDAVELLERFTDSYPLSPLMFRVAMRRAEILRSLGDFDKALLVLEGLIRSKPSDPSRPQAEMARADSLFGLAELRRDRNGQIDRQRIARAAAAYERVAEAWSKDSDEIRVEAWYKWSLALIERAKTETNSEATATRREARTTLIRPLNLLRSAVAGPGSLNTTQRFNSASKLWLARSILLLGEISEQDNDLEEALAAYRIIPELNRNLAPGEARLPGQATAESKLATLRTSASNNPTNKPQ